MSDVADKGGAMGATSVDGSASGATSGGGPAPGVANAARCYSEDDIDALGRRLLACTLPKAEWTHAAHLLAAAWLIAARPELDAPSAMPAIIRAYNEASGVANTDTAGYHDTITQASLRAVGAFLAGLPEGTPLAAACAQLLASPYADKAWLLAHWSPARLFSTPARRGWIEPDIAPLPF
ncbi:MAG: hypothetical protein V4857_30085 [Pseudomonadota bacterium]